MADLMSRLMQAGSIKSYLLSESPFFKERDVISTSVPILNIALSGKIDGGLMPGLTIFAGERATFKTRIGLELIKSYFTKYDESACLYYDSEFGSSDSYMSEAGISSEKIIHCTIENIETLKFDIVKRLEEIKRGDKAIIFIDSIGMLASNKEIEDAKNEKSVADMTRAKALRSLFRIITPHMVMKNIPCVIIAHTYQTMDMFSKTIVSGGTAPMYAANEVFNITKVKDSVGEGKDARIVGYDFNLRVLKSRTIRENSVLPLSVSYENGIEKYSGMIEICCAANIFEKPKKGYFQVPGEKKLMKYDEVLRMEDDRWNDILKMEQLETYIKNNYAISRK